MEQKRVSGLRLFHGEGRGEKRRKYFLNVFRESDTTLYQWPGPPIVQEAATTLTKCSQTVNPALTPNVTPGFPPHQPPWRGGRMG